LDHVIGAEQERSKDAERKRDDEPDRDHWSA
jgi:hypothetical protein